MEKLSRVTVDVPAGQEHAFHLLYRDFIAGDTPYQAQAEKEFQDKASEQARGLDSLQTLYEIAQRDSGQCHYIARFLAGLYNGYAFPFDLTDFRAIDQALFDHCMNVLRMDSRPAREVHEYFNNGGEKWQAMIARWGLAGEQLERARSMVEAADSADAE